MGSALVRELSHAAFLMESYFAAFLAYPPSYAVLVRVKAAGDLTAVCDGVSILHSAGLAQTTRIFNSLTLAGFPATVMV